MGTRLSLYLAVVAAERAEDTRMEMGFASVDSAAAGLWILGAVVLPSMNAAEEDMPSRRAAAVAE